LLFFFVERGFDDLFNSVATDDAGDAKTDISDTIVVGEWDTERDDFFLVSGDGLDDVGDSSCDAVVGGAFTTDNGVGSVFGFLVRVFNFFLTKTWIK